MFNHEFVAAELADLGYVLIRTEEGLELIDDIDHAWNCRHGVIDYDVPDVFSLTPDELRQVVRLFAGPSLAT